MDDAETFGKAVCMARQTTPRGSACMCWFDSHVADAGGLENA